MSTLIRTFFIVVCFCQSITCLGYELRCGQFFNRDPHAIVRIAQENMQIELLGFTYQSLGFALKFATQQNMPLDLLDQQFGFYKVNLVVPLRSGETKLEWQSNKERPELFESDVRKNGRYATLPATATVEFWVANGKSVSYKVPVKFAGLSYTTQDVTTYNAFGNTHSTSSRLLQMSLSGLGVLASSEVCVGVE